MASSPLDMPSTLIFWILLLPGLLVNGKPSGCGDMNIADVRHTFKEYNVGLVPVSFPDHQILKGDV
jgi:hypothetical protein